MKMKYLNAGLIILLLGCAPALADSWSERPDADFHAHPLQDIAVSGRDFARAEIVKVLRPASDTQSGLSKVLVVSGKYRGSMLYAENMLVGSHERLKQQQGVNVVISYKPGIEPQEILIDGYDRTGPMVLLVLLFIFSVIAVCGKRALAPLGALASAAVIIYFLFIPAVLTGESPLRYALISITAISALTLIAVAGLSRKSAAAFAGIAAGIIFTAATALYVYKRAHIAGFYMEEIQLLNYIKGINDPVFFRELLVAVLLFGASGIIMDIGISVASSVNELSRSRRAGFRALFRAGMNILRKIVATMINTLVLAYMGIYLGRTLIRGLQINSFFQALNLEPFHAELYQAIIGSMGYMAAAMVTLTLAAFLMKRLDKS